MRKIEIATIHIMTILINMEKIAIAIVYLEDLTMMNKITMWKMIMTKRKAMKMNQGCISV